MVTTIILCFFLLLNFVGLGFGIAKLGEPKEGNWKRSDLLSCLLHITLVGIALYFR